jgi:hypothetical protein
MAHTSGLSEKMLLGAKMTKEFLGPSLLEELQASSVSVFCFIYCRDSYFMQKFSQQRAIVNLLSLLETRHLYKSQ